MPVGVEGFQKERLTQARTARGLTAISLADMAGLGQATISQYEKGPQKPKQENLDKLAELLGVPAGYFLKPVTVERPEKLFYRSMSAATKSARKSAEARYQWALETVEYLLEYFDLPDVNIPDLDVPTDHREINDKQIEFLAEQLRSHWQLGDGPVVNMVRTLESNGVIVWRTALEARTLDAFSEFRSPHPVVVLSSDKQNFFRSRFDAAHELGHLILHRNIDDTNLRKSSDFKLIEEQAHHFAGAFLLPAVAYSNDVWAPSIDTFRALKPTWNVSIGLQIMRCSQLGLVNEEQAKRLWINRSRRGWSKSEPLDDSTPAETPTLIRTSIEMLLSERVRTKEQIVSDLCLSPADLEKLAELPPGSLGGQPTLVSPQLKSRDRNVVPFDKKRG